MRFKSVMMFFDKLYSKSDWLNLSLAGRVTGSYEDWRTAKMHECAPGEGETFSICYEERDGGLGFRVRKAGDFIAEEWRSGALHATFAAGDFHGTLLWIADSLPGHNQWRTDVMLEKLIGTAWHHGITAGSDARANDLEQHLRTMWSLLSREQKEDFLTSRRVAETFLGAKGAVALATDDGSLTGSGLEPGEWYVSKRGTFVRPVSVSDRLVTTLGIFEDSVMTIELGRFNDEFCRAAEVAR
ncbi:MULTISPECIES: hypothetical protein [Caballeronia]|uniref:hypothetical protein n=1 Tax=Caballeronia TaxID=1827195 RepID=UPI001FD50E75|nr:MULTISPECIES: hypothetical protein [Caballeronia]MDR5798918.1 hypothetical protein [Caballeronia sp. LZ001]